MATVYNNKTYDKSIEQMLKEFRKEVEKDGIIAELKKREYFKKDSTINHENNKKRETKIIRRNKKRLLELP